MEGDPEITDNGAQRKYFNPLPPHGGRLAAEYHLSDAQRDFNPLPPHGGRQRPPCPDRVVSNFNPLPPHGGRQQVFLNVLISHIFQSTPSAWRETQPVPRIFPGGENFNPLPPHGGRRLPFLCNTSSTFISIHSLRMEGDPILWIAIRP